MRSTTTLPGGVDECTVWHDVLALLFSDRRYTGNYLAYTDAILLLIPMAKQYGGEVRFLVSDLQMWWIGKFLLVFKSLSNYDLAATNRTRCFRHVQSRWASPATPTSASTRSARPMPTPWLISPGRHMRGSYSLPRGLAVPAAATRPRVLLIARANTRRFVNADEIVRVAQKLGFEVVVCEGTHKRPWSWPTRATSCWSCTAPG